MSELGGEKSSFFKKVVKLIRPPNSQKSVPAQKPPQVSIAIKEPGSMDAASNDIPSKYIERLPPEKIIVDSLQPAKDLDVTVIEEIKKVYPDMPLDWKVLVTRWKNNGGQTDLLGDVSRLREQIGELASRQDVVQELQKFRELLRNRFGDTIPVYRGSGDFRNDPYHSLTKDFFDPNSKFASASTLLSVASQFGAPVTGELENGKLRVEVTKYRIIPEDVVGFTPSAECELIVNRRALDAHSPVPSA